MLKDMPVKISLPWKHAILFLGKVSNSGLVAFTLLLEKLLTFKEAALPGLNRVKVPPPYQWRFLPKIMGEMTSLSVPYMLVATQL